MPCPLTHLGCLSFCCGPYRTSRYATECRIKPPWSGPFRLYRTELGQLRLPWAPSLTTEERLLALAQLDEQRTVAVSPKATIERVRYLLRQEYFQREQTRPPEWIPPMLPVSRPRPPSLTPPPPTARTPPPSPKPKTKKPRSPLEAREAKQLRAKRNREIYLSRLEGATLAAIAARYQLNVESVRQICAYQGRREKFSMLHYCNRRRGLNLGRPIDMGGPRDVWLTFWPTARRHE
jgi:hypothetical protein